MRPGCGLKFREGWFLARHTPPSAPTAGGKDPATENPKASSTVQTGKGGLGPGSLCELCPGGRKKKKKTQAGHSDQSCTVAVGLLPFFSAGLKCRAVVERRRANVVTLNRKGTREFNILVTGIAVGWFLRRAPGSLVNVTVQLSPSTKMVDGAAQTERGKGPCPRAKQRERENRQEERHRAKRRQLWAPRSRAPLSSPAPLMLAFLVALSGSV